MKYICNAFRITVLFKGKNEKVNKNGNLNEKMLLKRNNMRSASGL